MRDVRYAAGDVVARVTEPMVDLLGVVISEVSQTRGIPTYRVWVFEAEAPTEMLCSANDLRLVTRSRRAKCAKCGLSLPICLFAKRYKASRCKSLVTKFRPNCHYCRRVMELFSEDSLASGKPTPRMRAWELQALEETEAKFPAEVFASLGLSCEGGANSQLSTSLALSGQCRKGTSGSKRKTFVRRKPQH